MEFTIRKATEYDAEQIASVHYTAWTETYTGLLPESYLSARSVEKSIDLFRSIKCADTVVACADDLIIGFCGWGKFREPVPYKNIGEIHGIYLLKEFKRKHIGQRMMEYALEQLRNDGYQKAGLWMLNTNKAAVFYEKLGFVYNGTSKEVNLGEQVTELLYTIKL